MQCYAYNHDRIIRKPLSILWPLPQHLPPRQRISMRILRIVQTPVHLYWLDRLRELPAFVSDRQADGRAFQWWSLNLQLGWHLFCRCFRMHWMHFSKLHGQFSKWIQLNLIDYIESRMRTWLTSYGLFVQFFKFLNKRWKKWNRSRRQKCRDSSSIWFAAPNVRLTS